MDRAMRLVTVAGMGLLAGMAVGSGPALAADSQGGVAAKSPRPKAVQGHPRDDGRIAGYFRSPRDCEKSGHRGQSAHDWDWYDCDFVRHGSRHGFWALEVHRDRRGPWGPGPGHGPGPFGHGPGPDHGHGPGPGHGPDHGPGRGPHYGPRR
ncbi:hypothetical protein [Actinoplanes sp. NPDC051851]|uniref:hypothetical protein n=1 Tax=Actinoplanes sp. NPDC051851 TaxID=3154753 RepID=UPI00343B6B17